MERMGVCFISGIQGIYSEEMTKPKSKITYKEFMRQLSEVKVEMGRSWYKLLEAEFTKPRSHRTQ